jgi:proline racemase
VAPTVTGRAWVTAVAELRLDPSDPLINGLAWS